MAKLLISDGQFSEWLARHRAVEAAGIPLVPERNEQMRGTYAMLDARGRFFTNAGGAHAYGATGFEHGFAHAWQSVASDGGFDAQGFAERGGAYEWAPGAAAAAERALRGDA